MKKEKENFTIFRESITSNNYLVTVAIGEEYLNNWKNIALSSWMKYCEKYDLGLIVFINDLIDKKNSNWKKANWQKLLIGVTLKKYQQLVINNICYLDTDIIINTYAPNVFNNYDEDTIALVSLRKNLPYPYDEVLRRLAFLRHKHYSTDYPLDSVLFVSLEDLYKTHNLVPQNDETCTGLFIYNLDKHSEMMKEWFYKYSSDVYSITNGGEQTHLNYEFLNYGKVSWLDYKFQAIWVFEMAWKYPFLYNYGRDDKNLIRECIEASLTTNYFLHFAGSWYESDMWKIGHFFEDKYSEKLLEEYFKYIQQPVIGKPQGMIKAKKEKNDR